ncbi:MAG: DUF2948 family protein [Paracoccaceae bacterium]|nr:DUF2948 family protein [Paracoccaceae bacterium]
MSSEKTYFSPIEKLALYGHGGEDVSIISALLQDSVLLKKNIKWNKKRNRFSLLVNRFRWELMQDNISETLPYKRVQTMLLFNGVIAVYSQNLQRALNNEILSLLSLNLTSNENFDEIKLSFSGNTSIKLKIEFIEVLVKDLDTSDFHGKSTVPTHDN